MRSPRPSTSTSDRSAAVVARVDTGDRRTAQDLVWAIALLSTGAALASFTGHPTVVVALVVLAAALFAWRRHKDAQRIEEELAWQALHDPLTGLPNRRLLADRFAQGLARTKRTSRWVTVICLDLDRFAALNETWGHDVGDEVLRRVATRLQATLRPTDTLGRLGGDQFVAICDEVPAVSVADDIAARLAVAFQEPFDVDGTSIVVTASAGVAVSRDPGAELADLLREADAALAHAKDAGDGALSVRNAKAGGASERALLERRLRRALDNGEFTLRYQPVCTVSDGTIEGVEALLRWDDPEHGLTPPGDFVPLLEDSGLIVPVGAWVLREACRQAAEWERSTGCSLHIAVNVSPRQLSQTNFAEETEGALEAAGLDPSRLWLEITEAAVMNDASAAWSMLRQLKAAGAKLAADDFGTGYSSLSYIRRFALDMLKIDKSFVDGMVANPEDLAIVESILGIGRALGLRVVAEGVEQPEQLAILDRLGCHLVQGFLLHRPMEATAVSALFAPDPAAVARVGS